MTFTFSDETITAIIVNVAILGVAWGSMREQLKQLRAKAEGHDDMRDVVTKLTSEVEHLRDALKQQPAMIAQIVAATIKETLRLLRPA